MNNKIIIGNLINYNDYINFPRKKYAQLYDDEARTHNDIVYTMKWELINDKQQLYRWLDSSNRKGEFDRELFDTLIDLYGDYIEEIVIKKINYEFDHSDKPYYTEFNRKLKILEVKSNWKKEFENPKWTDILVYEAEYRLKDNLNGPLWDVTVIKNYVDNKINDYKKNSQ